MIDFLILISLSFSSGVKFLIESGYNEGSEIKVASNECDSISYYTYVLYGEDKEIIDVICHKEYCNLDEWGEYDCYKAEWSRINESDYNIIKNKHIV